MPDTIIPIADLATVTPGDSDFVVGSQNGEARKFPAATFLGAAAQALAGSGVFDTTAAGLAATTTGQYFSVPGADAGDYLILYRNNAGSAVEVKRYPSAARVDAVEASVQQVADETEGYRAAGDPILPIAPVGFAWAVVDRHGMVAAGVTDDGTFKAAAFDTTRVIAEAVAVNTDELSGHPPHGYATAVIDPAGNMAFGITLDGKTRALDIEPQAINGIPTALVTAGSVKTGGRFHADINHIISYGQSLSLGNGALPIQTATQPYDNLKFNGGVRAQDGGADVAANHASFVPLVETMNPSSGNGETPAGYATTMVKRLLLSENLLSHTQQSYQLLASAPGEGNTSIAMLSKGSLPYTRLIADITYGYSLSQAAGKSYNVTAVLWSQGERDLSLGTTYAAYLAAFNTLYADLNSDAKAITGQANDIKLIAYQVSQPGSQPWTVAIAQLDASRADPRIVIACPAYCTEPALAGDVHKSGKGSAHLGAYYGIAYKRTVIDGLPFLPLMPVATERQGTVVTVRFAVPVEPLAFDTTQLAARTNHGFTLVDNTGAAVTISSVTLTGPNSVRIVAAAPLPANSRVRYGYSSGSVPGGNLRDSQGAALTAELPGGQVRLDNWCVAFDELLV